MRTEPLAREPLIILAGPTASGKSRLALEFCLHLRARGLSAEILCADSITVYRGFDIGSAKPSAEDTSLVPHHLLDLCAPEAEFTASDFIETARAVISRLHNEEKIPVLVGGTGFYLRALTQGMVAEQKEDRNLAEEIKARILARALSEGWEELYRELLQRDPAAAQTVHANDHYRIQRALQAMELHGERWSVMNARVKAAPTRYPGLRYFALRVSKAQLAERIEVRTQAMLEAGLVREVRGLLEQGVSAQAKPMQSVGYKETVASIAGEISEQELATRIAQETLKLAKRQLTWFQGEKSVEWVENLSDLKQALVLG